MQRRLYFDLFMPIIIETDVRRAVVLMGPRRVGKTVMMHHALQYLLETLINPLKVVFISIESSIYNNIGIEQLFSFCRKATKQEIPKDW